MIFSVLVILNSFQSNSLIECQKKTVHICEGQDRLHQKHDEKNNNYKTPGDSRLLCKVTGVVPKVLNPLVELIRCFFRLLKGGKISETGLK